MCKKNNLLIENNDVNFLLTKEILKNYIEKKTKDLELDIKRAKNPNEIISKTISDTFDLILMNINASSKTQSLLVYTKIKHIDEKIPIIIQLHDEYESEEELKIFFDEIIKKPQVINNFVNTVSKYLVE